MFAAIKEFLLLPALLTVGLLVLPALLAAWWARRSLQNAKATTAGGETPGRGTARAVAACIAGLALTLVGILLWYSLAVVRGIDWLRLLAWPTVFAGWLLAFGLARVGWRRTALLALLLCLAAYLLDTQVTDRLLFE